MTRWSSSTFFLARPKVPSYAFVSFGRPKRNAGGTYPLLGELTGTLVTAIAEEFDDATLVGGEAEEGNG